MIWPHVKEDVLLEIRTKMEPSLDYKFFQASYMKHALNITEYSEEQIKQVKDIFGENPNCKGIIQFINKNLPKGIHPIKRRTVTHKSK